MAGRPQAEWAVPELGLRRVRWVRITVGSSGPVCMVAGQAHRRPVVRSVPLRTATALLAAGVPGWVHDVRMPVRTAAAAARNGG